jgi:hypothetical protein
LLNPAGEAHKIHEALSESLAPGTGTLSLRTEYVRLNVRSSAQADAGLLEEHPLFDPDSAAPDGGKEAARACGSSSLPTLDGGLRRDMKMARRISKLIIDVQRDPQGTGERGPPTDSAPH